jgi:pimeloyl-ACP methyl ester carboxylesterase
MNAPGLLACILSLAGATAALGSDEPGNWATVNGHRIYYEVRGAGRPLVLLHGGGGDIPGAWSHQLGDFSRSHRVIAIEQAGHGHSPDVPGPMTYAGMTEDTAALLEQLGVKGADIVGWSDGGIEALMLAVRHPELVRRVVATGANVDPSGASEGTRDWVERTPPEGFMDAGKGSYYAAHSPDGPAHAVVVGAKLKELWLTRPKPDELTFEMLGRIRAPVLIMAGDHDAISLEHTLRIYQAIPGAKLWILPGTGHDTFVSRPEWTNPLVLAFLD